MSTATVDDFIENVGKIGSKQIVLGDSMFKYWTHTHTFCNWLEYFVLLLEWECGIFPTEFECLVAETKCFANLLLWNENDFDRISHFDNSIKTMQVYINIRNWERVQTHEAIPLLD